MNTAAASKNSLCYGGKCPARRAIDRLYADAKSVVAEKYKIKKILETCPRVFDDSLYYRNLLLLGFARKKLENPPDEFWRVYYKSLAPISSAAAFVNFVNSQEFRVKAALEELMTSTAKSCVEDAKKKIDNAEPVSISLGRCHLDDPPVMAGPRDAQGEVTADPAPSVSDDVAVKFYLKCLDFDDYFTKNAPPRKTSFLDYFTAEDTSPPLPPDNIYDGLSPNDCPPDSSSNNPPNNPPDSRPVSECEKVERRLEPVLLGLLIARRIELYLASLYCWLLHRRESHHRNIL